MNKFIWSTLQLRLRSILFNHNYILTEPTVAMSTHKRKGDGSVNSNLTKIACVNKVNIDTALTIASQNISHSKFNMNSIEVMETPDKSQNDKKSYRIVRLANGLKALLVSDPTPISKENEKCGDTEVNSHAHVITAVSDNEDDVDEEGEETDEDEDEGEDNQEREKLAACSLCIDVGSFSDPRDVQGLAHFLEHMIFMGSEKYPTENELDQYLKKSGGSDNAHTDLDETLFYFEIREQCLDGALDRFSNLFKAPLLLKEAMTRERKAIESEFSSQMNDESVRREQLLSSMGQLTHPASIFPWGNSKTLNDNIDDDVLYQKVNDFRKRHYSAHRMYVCLQARQSLDELQDLVVRHFSIIPNNQLFGVDFSLSTEQNAFQSKFHEKVFFVKPIGNISQIDINWCLGPALKYYKCKPHHYLSFILGYEGKGSLLSYLRKKLWAIDLSAGIDTGFSSNSLFSLFNISIHLTDNGFAHLDDVLKAIFSYTRLLKVSGPNEQLFHELQRIEENTFRFENERDPYDNVQELVLNLKQYPAKHVLNGDSLYFEYDAEAIQGVINDLNTRKFNIMITSTHLYDENVKYDQKEEWFGTEYCERNMPDKWISFWNDAVPFDDFSLPEPNPFIADNFTIVYDKSQILPKYPVKIFDNDVCELWFRQDDKFLLPIAHYYFYFTTPQAFSTIDNMILMTLYSTLLNFQLVEKLYAATVAGLEYSCYSADKGLVLKVSGYNQKLNIIVDAFTKCVKSLADDVTEEQFQVFAQQQYKSYENIFLKPKSISKDLRLSVVEHHHLPLHEKNQRLKSITFADFQKFCREYCQQIRIQAIMQGNLTEETAQAIIQNALSNLSCGKVQDLASMQLRCSKIPLGSTYLRVNAFNPNDVNTVITNFYQIGPTTFRTNILIDLLMEIAEEPVFDILRNKEQLGYDVSCSLRDNYGILGYAIVINSQEHKHSVDHVDDRIENFRHELEKIIDEITATDFNEYKVSLAKMKLTEDNKLKDEINRNWSEITNGEYIFDRPHREIECLATITQKDLLQFYRENSGENERKFSTEVIGNPNGNESEDKKAKNPDRSFDNLTYVEFKTPNTGCLIKDIMEFKQTLELYPARPHLTNPK